MAFPPDGDFSDIRTSDIRAHQSISPFGTNSASLHTVGDEAEADAYDPALYSGSPLLCACCAGFIDKIFARAALIYQALVKKGAGFARRVVAAFCLMFGLIFLAYGLDFQKAAKNDAYEEELSALRSYISAWNDKYREQSDHLTFYLGTAGAADLDNVESDQLLTRKRADRLASTFPQASKLRADEDYLPLSFYLGDISKTIKAYRDGKRQVN